MLHGNRLKMTEVYSHCYGSYLFKTFCETTKNSAYHTLLFQAFTGYDKSDYTSNISIKFHYFDAVIISIKKTTQINNKDVI